MEITRNLNDDRYNWAASIINECDTVAINVFDIGARDGLMHKLIENRKVNYEGFDKEPLNTHIKRWNIEEENKILENKADYILFLDIVEHLNNPWTCINNLTKTLKVGGKLIMTTPNPLWSNSRFTFFANNYLPCFAKSDLRLNHHVFTPWPHIIEKLLIDHGFVIEVYVTLGGKTALFDKHLNYNPLRIFKRFVMVQLERRDNSSCGMSYGIVARKA